MKTNEKILTVATMLFDSRGIQASGVDTIIAESGVAKATLYKHFPSKNHLVMAYLRSKSDKFYEWLNSRLVSKKANSIDILVSLCELVETWITTPEFHGLPFHIASVEFPSPEHPINQYSAVLAAELQDYLSKIAQTAGARDAVALGQQLTIIFEGAALVERLNPGSGAASRAKSAAIALINSSI